MHFADLRGGDQVIDQLWKPVYQQREPEQAAEKHQAGGQYEAPLFTHQSREVCEDECHNIGAQLAAMAIQLLMAAQHLLL
ncbi:hypothetical protein D3C81_1581630 [compost metagenome]